MSAADFARLALIISLGFLAFLVFIVATTIAGLMAVESSGCACGHYPIGIYVLAIVGIMLLTTLIDEAIYTPSLLQMKIQSYRDAFIVMVIFFFVVLLLLR